MFGVGKESERSPAKAALYVIGAFLIDRGVNVNADKQGWTALHQIIRLRRTNIGFLPPPVGKGSLSSVELITKLIAAGANVNAAEKWGGTTPLMWAVSEGHVEVTRTLLDHGAAVDARSASQFTPLLFAARRGDVALARLLVAAGYCPASVLEVGSWDQTLATVVDVLRDPALSAQDRTEFRQVIQVLASRWRRPR